MKKHLTLGLLIAGTSYAQAQDLMSTSGDHYETGNISWTFAMGEPVIETVSSSSITLTQGFLQVYDSQSSVGLAENSPLEFTVYPNPANDFIEVNSPNNDVINGYSLYSFANQLMIHSEEITEQQIRIDISAYSTGIYFLYIRTKSGRDFTQKIIKN